MRADEPKLGQDHLESQNGCGIDLRRERELKVDREPDDAEMLLEMKGRNIPAHVGGRPSARERQPLNADGDKTKERTVTIPRTKPGSNPQRDESLPQQQKPNWQEQQARYQEGQADTSDKKRSHQQWNDPAAGGSNDRQPPQNFIEAQKPSLLYHAALMTVGAVIAGLFFLLGTRAGGANKGPYGRARRLGAVV
jgi:hypothetical protein